MKFEVYKVGLHGGETTIAEVFEAVTHADAMMDFREKYHDTNNEMYMLHSYGDMYSYNFHQKKRMGMAAIAVESKAEELLPKSLKPDCIFEFETPDNKYSVLCWDKLDSEDFAFRKALEKMKDIRHSVIALDAKGEFLINECKDSDEKGTDEEFTVILGYDEDEKSITMWDDTECILLKDCNIGTEYQGRCNGWELTDKDAELDYE